MRGHVALLSLACVLLAPVADLPLLAGASLMLCGALLWRRIDDHVR